MSKLYKVLMSFDPVNSASENSLVDWGGPSTMFGVAWNVSSVAVVQNVTGTRNGCPLCVLTAQHAYPGGFPGRSTNPACNMTRA